MAGFSRRGFLGGAAAGAVLGAFPRPVLAKERSRAANMAALNRYIQDAPVTPLVRCASATASP